MLFTSCILYTTTVVVCLVGWLQSGLDAVESTNSDVDDPLRSLFSCETAPPQSNIAEGEYDHGRNDFEFMCANSVRFVEQGPGDVIYVPAAWGHAVLDLEQTVAVAAEFLRY